MTDAGTPVRPVTRSGEKSATSASSASRCLTRRSNRPSRRIAFVQEDPHRPSLPAVCADAFNMRHRHGAAWFVGQPFEPHLQRSRPPRILIARQFPRHHVRNRRQSDMVALVGGIERPRRELDRGLLRIALRPRRQIRERRRFDEENRVLNRRVVREICRNRRLPRDVDDSVPSAKVEDGVRERQRRTVRRPLDRRTPAR